LEQRTRFSISCPEQVILLSFLRKLSSKSKTSLFPDMGDEFSLSFSRQRKNKRGITLVNAVEKNSKHEHKFEVDLSVSVEL
jgi:hypothetical protein